MVTLRPKEVRCEADPRTDEALCEINCPVCRRVVYAKTTHAGVKIIQAAGAVGIEGLVPCELLERRSGPPLLWDEALDMLADLDATLYPQTELANQLYAPMPRPGASGSVASSTAQPTSSW